MLNDFFLRFKIILRSNIFLGLFFFLKKKIQKKTIYKDLNYSKIVDVIGIGKKKQTLITFAKNSKLESKFIDEANLFVNGYIKIYNKKIFLKNYLVDRFNQNRDRKEIYNLDIRFHWEIYRTKFLFNINFAYLITKDEKYAIAIIDFLKDWEKHSPCIEGRLVYNGMEASIKLMNLSLIEPIIKESIYYTKAVQKEFAKTLIFHAEYVYTNYEITKYGLESNHGLTCAVGLIYASLLFPNYKNSREWSKLGYRALYRSLKNQFTDDGVNFESSVNYHRFVFEVLIFLLAALYKSKKKVDTFIVEKIKRIGNSLIKLTHANDMISRFGDSDGGKFLFDENNISDFNNMEYLSWFTSLKKKAFLETIIFSNIYEFDGFLGVKNLSGKVGNYIYLKNGKFSFIASANEIGTKGKGNHQHNDFLSFELYGKSPFIVDPWSFCYTGSYELRNKDRKTETHNNIIIDNREIVEFNKNRLFEMLGNIKTKINRIAENNQKLTAVLSHNGYKNLKSGKQLHTREFNINKIENSIKIIDTLSGSGFHSAGLNFHIPKAYWNIKRKESTVVFYNDIEEFSLSWNQLTPTIKDGVISNNFLNKMDSYHLSIYKEYANNFRLETTIQYNKLK